jgi:GDP-L-fucose synthase
MLRKFITAKHNNLPEVELWGTGRPRREFLHVDDLATASLHLMKHYNEKGLVNIGTGEDVTIEELAELIKSITGYEGDIRWNTDKPDGTSRKLMDVSKIKRLGWKAAIDLPTGIKMLYKSIKDTKWN